jgi:hypothetical protein
VVNARHKGAMVRVLTREDIVDLYELRPSPGPGLPRSTSSGS